MDFHWERSSPLPAIADSLEKPSISTFGGNPVSTAAANAVLDEIEQEKLVENSPCSRTAASGRLKRDSRNHPEIIGEVRGMGLMHALELVVDETRKDRTPNPAAKAAFFEETKNEGSLLVPVVCMEM